MSTQNMAQNTWAWNVIARLGGWGILTLQDLPDLDSQRGKVLDLLLDRRWHTGPEILRVSGGTEGLRRLRELRTLPGYTIERRKAVNPFSRGKRVFEYRLVKS